MKNSEAVMRASREVFEYLKGLSQEEFDALLEKHAGSELAKSLVEAGAFGARDISITATQEEIDRGEVTIHFRFAPPSVIFPADQ